MPAATRRDTQPPSATSAPVGDLATDEQPINGAAPPVRSAVDGARLTTADKISALAERVAGLEVSVGLHEKADENRHDETMRSLGELRDDMRTESGGTRKLLMAQLGVVVLVVCILAGIVGIKVVVDGKGGITVDPDGHHPTPTSTGSSPPAAPKEEHTAGEGS